MYLRKNNFIETKTVPWDNHVTIKVDEGTYIKNIRMINQKGVIKTIEILYDKKQVDQLFVLGFPVYQYLYDIKNSNYLPFFLNKTGIYNDISIVTQSLHDDKQLLEGSLRYDIYKANTQETHDSGKASYLEGNTVSGYLYAITKHCYNEKRSKSFLIDDNELYETHYVRKDPNNVFQIYKPSNPILLNNYTVPPDVICTIHTHI